MKATITFKQNDTQTGGLFNKTTERSYHVTAKIQLSEEEQAIVREAHIGDALVHERDASGKNATTPFIVRYDIDKCVSEGLHDVFNTPVKAREFAEKLKGDILPGLKSYIEGNRTLDTSPIELEF